MRLTFVFFGVIIALSWLDDIKGTLKDAPVCRMEQH
jgi:hypothetical protein